MQNEQILAGCLSQLKEKGIDQTTQNILQELANKDIKTAIHFVLEQVSPEKLFWSNIATQLLHLDISNSYEKAWGEKPYKNLKKRVTIGVEKGYYSSDVAEVINRLPDDLIDHLMKDAHQKDCLFSYAGMNLLCNRYLVRNHENKIIEMPQDMFLIVAALIARKSKDFLNKIQSFYKHISDLRISLATPILLNLRRPNPNLSSCFIGAIDDSLDGIYYSLDQLAQISKRAGGCGVNLTRIRSKGSYIQGYKGVSSGVIPWLKLINDTSIAVNQLGSRSGAITAALDIWHLDIHDFLDCQTENGDLRRKCYDIFPQVVVSDLFMERVEANTDWTLLDPKEVRDVYNVELAEVWGEGFNSLYPTLEKSEKLKLKKVVKARDLFKTLLKTAVETGLPYVFFKDTVNRLNPNKHEGMIGSGNLCQESWSNFKPTKVGKKEFSGDVIEQTNEPGQVHVCNLLSINLSTFRNDYKMSLTQIESTCNAAIEILDNMIDITEAPIPEANYHNNIYRIIGLGYMGLHDHLVDQKLTYKKGIDYIDGLFRTFSYYAIKKSAELAIERGVYPKFPGSDWSKGIVLGKDKEYFRSLDLNEKEKRDWINLLDQIQLTGIRNGSVFAIAPNTSTSLLANATASVLPSYKKFYIDKGSKGAIPVFPPHLDPKNFWYYQENINMNQQVVIDAIATIQKWVDQGISMELYLNLNHGIVARDVYELYRNAWKKGCKTVYYIRSVALKDDKVKQGIDCVSCAN